MNTNLTIDLNNVEIFPENTVITTDDYGNPLSYIYDDEWEYSSMQKVAVGKTTKVTFKSIPIEYRQGVQRSLHHVIKYLTERDKVKPTISSVERWRSGLSMTAKALGHCNWNELLNKKTFKEFQSNIKSLSLKLSALAKPRIALNKLYECNLCARAFAISDFRYLGRDEEVEQHIAIPINMYQKLLQKAISDVERYHQYRHDINKLMEHGYLINHEELARVDVSQTTNAARQRGALRCGKIAHSIPNFKITLVGGDYARIQVSCIIVVLAFSGARVGEVLSFRKDSYEEIRTEKTIIARLKGDTSKGNDGLPKAVSWQTHPIAKDALELAYDMTDHLRQNHTSEVNEKLESGSLSKGRLEHVLRELKGAFIPLVKSQELNSYVLKGLDLKIKTYMRNMRICAVKDEVNEFDMLNPSREGQLKLGGELPRLSPHDFRRTFAVFFKRYGFGSVSAIKFQYKHENIEMSDYYANNAALQAMEDVLLDTDLLELMKVEGINLGVDIFDEIYHKSQHLSGIGGERIAQEKFNAIKDGKKVYMSRTEIEVLVRNGSLSVVKLPTGGYCLNATCSRVCGISQFSAETKPCEHKVVTDTEAKILLRQNKRLVGVFRGMNTGDSLNQSLLVGMKQKIKLNEMTLIKHELKFEYFEDAVLGLISLQEV
jgi:integrase